MPVSHRQITIATWNAQGIKNKKHELENFLNDHEVDIMLLTETFLKYNINFFVNGYYCYRKDRENQSKGGIGILIKRQLVHSVISDLNLKSIDCIGITLKLSRNAEIKIFCCYCPNSSHPNFPADISKLTRQNTPYILGGDLNCKHQKWVIPKPVHYFHLITRYNFNGLFPVTIT